jgi:hypothetical protein
MSFDHRDIRKAMDVYTLDNAYLGTVLAITPGSPTTDLQPSRGRSQQQSIVSGEMLGPMPTQPLGNPGPRTQSAALHYATGSDSARPIGRGTIEVGKWWGLVGRRTIPLEDIQTVSLERVVLKRQLSDLDHPGTAQGQQPDRQRRPYG